VGDSVAVQTVRGVFGYEVRAIEIVAPDRGDLTGPTGDERLTLVTCYPFHWIGPAPMRMVIQAVPIPSPAGPRPS
jgi:sortase A